MSKSYDFVYEQVFKGAVNAGCINQVAHSQAQIALDRYKKSSMGGLSVGRFIQDQIKQAKRQNSKLKR